MLVCGWLANPRATLTDLVALAYRAIDVTITPQGLAHRFTDATVVVAALKRFQKIDIAPTPRRALVAMGPSRCCALPRCETNDGCRESLSPVSPSRRRMSR